MFALNVVLTVKQESDIEHVKQLLTECVRLSREEDGCLMYEACHSHTDPKIFMLCERWASEAAWKAHRDQRAYKEYYHPQVIPLVDRMPHPSTLLEPSSPFSPR